MSHAIEFIETSVFTKQFNEIGTDEELRTLQSELIADSESGSLITGTGGLRKIRVATVHQGKSGSSRVIYFLAQHELIYLVLAYPKSKKDSLSDREKSDLKKLTKLLKSEVKK
jgi:hypothetical protein